MNEVWTSEAAWAVYGVGAGGVLTVSLDLVRHRLGRRSRGADLARRAVVQLDSYIDDLADWAQRDTTPYISSNAYPDGPVLPEGVDWSAIDKQLAYELLKLPASHRSALRYLEFFNEIESEDEVREQAQIKVSEMAHAADKCALRLRKKYGFPSRVTGGAWDPMTAFVALPSRDTLVPDPPSR